MTIHLSDIFDLDLLEQMLDEGMVKRSLHPNGNLALLNYTPAAQYSKTWNEVTRACRGLIYNRHDLSVVARPFEKFFNLGEHDVLTLPDEPYRVFEKMDGSLGILYFDGEDWAIATRGSFTSDQALWATNLLRTKYLDDFCPDRDFTYLFEIIYPENRIVVDYNGMADLVLLDILETATGKQAFDREWFCWQGPWVDEHEVLLDEIIEQERPNHEGYVLVYRSGLRVKVKHEEYVKMHAIVTNTSSRTVWEYLSEGRDVTELLSFVPDEFADWVNRQIVELTVAYMGVISAANTKLHDTRSSLPSDHARKDFALAVKDYEYKSVLFRWIDDRSASDIIWKIVKPARTLPFREAEDAA